jgi:hypothetical protein
MVFKMACAFATSMAKWCHFNSVLVGLAQPTFRRHDFGKQLRVQLVVGVGVGTMRNLSNDVKNSCEILWFGCHIHISEGQDLIATWYHSLLKDDLMIDHPQGEQVCCYQNSFGKLMLYGYSSKYYTFWEESWNFRTCMPNQDVQCMTASHADDSSPIITICSFFIINHIFCMNMTTGCD